MTTGMSLFGFGNSLFIKAKEGVVSSVWPDAFRKRHMARRIMDIKISMCRIFYAKSHMVLPTLSVEYKNDVLLYSKCFVWKPVI